MSATKKADNITYCVSLPKVWVEKLTTNKIFITILSLLSTFGIGFGVSEATKKAEKCENTKSLNLKQD